MEEHLGDCHDFTVKIYQNLGELLLLMGRKEEALGLLEKAAKGLEVLRGRNSVAACKTREWVRIVRNVDREE